MGCNGEPPKLDSRPEAIQEWLLEENAAPWKGVLLLATLIL